MTVMPMWAMMAAHKAERAEASSHPLPEEAATLHEFLDALLIALNFDTEPVFCLNHTYFVKHFLFHSNSPVISRVVEHSMAWTCEGIMKIQQRCFEILCITWNLFAVLFVIRLLMQI
jgi:hypothetical protein